jgi:hypothetical protein
MEFICAEGEKGISVFHGIVNDIFSYLMIFAREGATPICGEFRGSFGRENNHQRKHPTPWRLHPATIRRFSSG